MQPIFTMQYGEFKVADYLTDNIKGSSVFIPASAQEKGIDLLLYRYGDGKNKVVTIQVKMSRTYHDHNNGFNNHLWFKRFEVQSNADWYILMGIYAKHPKGDKATNSKVADTGWNHIMLAFTNTEMESFMDSVRQKKNPEKPDSMFGFSFDEELSEIWQTRGYKEHRNMTKFLIQNRIDEIDASFDKYEKKHELLTKHISELEMLMDDLKDTWNDLRWGYRNGVMHKFEADIYKFIDKHPEMYATGLERADVRLFLLAVIIGLTSWAGLARLLRAETMKVSAMDFVTAAKAFGVSSTRIMARHVFPNVAHIVLIVAVLDFSGIVLYEAVLSYVGVGVDPVTDSFGSMINAAASEMSRSPVIWWNLAASFVFMVALVLSANLFASGVRDAFDPRNAGGKA